VSIVLLYLLRISQPRPQSLILAVCLSISVGAVILLQRELFASALRWIEILTMASLIAIFIITAALFTRLTVTTERAIRAQNVPYSFRLSFYLPDIEASYEEYLRVPGFDQDKERLRNFLEKARSDTGSAK